MSATQYRSAFEVVSNPQARHPLATWSSDRSAINRDLLVVGAFCVVGSGLVFGGGRSPPYGVAGGRDDASDFGWAR